MPIITLLSDFGTRDSYVGEVKGVLLSLAPGVELVDVTHEIAPGDVAAGAYLLGRVWRRFPAGTVHFAVVDPGVGTGRAALAFRVEDHGFVGPDNGLFGRVLYGRQAEVALLSVPEGAAPTFHGRDLFAPAAAALARGVPPAELGTPYIGMPRRVSAALPRHEGSTVVGEVIYVDRFGNLVTNLTPDLVPASAVLETDAVEIGPLRATFAAVEPGSLLAYLGSGGEIEIGLRDGSAAQLLGLGVGASVRARLDRS